MTMIAKLRLREAHAALPLQTRRTCSRNSTAKWRQRRLTCVNADRSLGAMLHRLAENGVRSLHLIPLLTAMMLAACVSPPDASPQVESESAARGREVAQRLCASCHSVGRHGSSPRAGAPAFRDLSKLYPVADLAESLVEGLMTGHPDMPEYQFTPEGAEDFIAYLENIQSPGNAR